MLVMVGTWMAAPTPHMKPIIALAGESNEEKPIPPVDQSPATYTTAWGTTQRSQKNRRTGWDWFADVTARLPLPSLGSHIPGHHVRHDAGYFREEPGAGKPPADL